MSIPKPSGSEEKKNEGNPDADCPEYEPVMGDYCKYYVTRNGECIKKVGLCDGFGVLKSKN